MHLPRTWYTCTISTASVAVVISQQPYVFRGLNTIGKIFFILDIVLFVGFTAVISIRFLMDTEKPKRLKKSLHRPPEALFFGPFWVSIALMLICTQQYGVPSSGPWLVKTLQVLFWIYVAFALLVAIFQYSGLFMREQIAIEEAIPAWGFPSYPLLLVGPLAALLIPSQPAYSGLQLLVGGFALQGLAWLISLLMLSAYYLRLMAGQPLPSGARPGMFVAVGPAGYTSNALIALAKQAPAVVPTGFLNIAGFNTGAALVVTGTFAGIFVFLFAFWFFALATVSCLQGAGRDMKFTLNWWAIVFPNAGMILALIQIGNSLQSPGIKWLASVLSAILVAFWIFTAVACIRAVWKRQILWEGQDEDAGQDDDEEDEKKESDHEH